MENLEALIERSRGGDHEAFGEIVRRFQSAVFGWTYSAIGNWHDAEDATQEVFVTAYRKLDKLRVVDGFPGWLRQIAKTACNRRTRRQELDTEPVDEWVEDFHAANPAETFECSELRDAIMSALRSLSPDLRTCIRMHYLEGYSVREIAYRLSVPPGTVKRRLHDARTSLRPSMHAYKPTSRRMTMTTELEGLRWHPSWTSHMGCIKAAVDWLHAQSKIPVPITRAWIWGGTGHAFIINLSADLCPSGPTAWHTEMLFRNGANLGYRVEGLFTDKSAPDFYAKQEAAWMYVRRNLDGGYPCYGWDLKIPEFYVIHGYDDVGYYFSGATVEDSAGPLPWQKVGETEIGVLELYSVLPEDPKLPQTVVKDAFSFALRHASDPGGWKHERYYTGPAAFDTWADSLEKGRAIRFGLGYNAEVWLECRTEAVSFLREAKERVGGDGLFDEAIERYGIVRELLKQVRDRYPMEGPGGSQGEAVTCAETAAIVRNVAAAERKSLETLQRIVDTL